MNSNRIESKFKTRRGQKNNSKNEKNGGVKVEDQMMLMAFGMLGGLLIISFLYEVLQTRRMYHLEKMMGDAILKIDTDIEKLRNELIDKRFR